MPVIRSIRLLKGLYLQPMNKIHKSVWSVPVLVAALGYFVDIYDLVLFSIVRKPSLTALGIAEADLEKNGLLLLNIQMIGMLIGGIVWGIMGDRKGRLKVLFGSILLYSLANILNAYVHNVTEYSVLRFVAGFGLAGELGAGITLVSEILHKEHRGWATTMVATIGVSGAVFAGIMGMNFEWTTTYIIGGVLGLGLLLLRFSVYESGMFEEAKSNAAHLGNLGLVFFRRNKLFTYLKCILIGLPIWYCIGILITLSPELGKELGIVGTIEPPMAIIYCYVGVTLGDLSSGVLSQLMKSRRKILQYYVLATLLMVIVYFLMKGRPVQEFYLVFALLGFAAGYWAVLVTSASEQFGTNVRASVTTTVPNFIRGALVPISLLYTFLKSIQIGTLNAALVTGIVCCSLAYLGAYFLDETFGKDLNYYEE